MWPTFLHLDSSISLNRREKRKKKKKKKQWRDNGFLLDLHSSTYHSMVLHDLKNNAHNRFQTSPRPKAFATHRQPSSSRRQSPQISSQSRQILRPNYDLKTRPNHHCRCLLPRHGQTSPPNPRPVSLLQKRPGLHDRSQP